MKVFETDQWTAVEARRQGVTLEQAKETDGAVYGGDADTVRAIFGGGKLREITVADSDWPPIGRAWLVPDLEGRLVVFRAKYDTSD